LAEPANRTLTNDNSPTFVWSAVIDGHTYQLQIDDDRKFGSPTVDETLDVGLLTYVADELPDGRYFWRVRAINSVGVPGRWSRSWRLTIDVTPPTIPILVGPADGTRVTNRKLTLEWEKSVGADRYELRLDTDPAFPLPPIDVGSRPKYRLPTTLAQATYHWQVRAVDKAGNVSGWSESRTFHLVAGNTSLETPVPTPVPDSDPVQPGEPPVQWIVPTEVPPHKEPAPTATPDAPPFNGAPNEPPPVVKPTQTPPDHPRQIQ
jgi:hypothetical protein